MRFSLIALATLASASAAVAQSQTFTTPNGYDTVEGNAAFFHWTASRRMQVMDNTNRTLPIPALKQVAFRRDRLGGGSGSGARNFNVEFSVGYHSWGLAQSTFDANYKPGTKQTVYTLKPTNIPDWTQVPATPPGPWDLVLLFDSQFTYLANDALLWDLVLQGATGSGSMDRHYTAYELSGGSATLGAGCIATGQTSAAGLSLSCVNHGTAGYGLRPSVARGPATSPVYIGLDVVASNLQVPGLCGTLYVAPLILVSSGSLLTSTAGSLTFPEIRLPPIPGLPGNSLFVQAYLPDAGQSGLPITLTEGRSVVVPNPPAPGIECIYHWQTLPATQSSFLFTGGAPLAQFSN